jgi:hypothetical protein
MALRQIHLRVEVCMAEICAVQASTTLKGVTMNLMSLVTRPASLMIGLGLCASVAVAANSYQVRNLVSDGGVTADHHDGNLVNGWGVAFTTAIAITQPIDAADFHASQ